jgi:valyl-tRNA synthetase
MLRLLAPFIPFATEEVWSWTHDGSVHTASWPKPRHSSTRTGLLTLVGEALIGIRRAKTEKQASQKTVVTTATIAGPALLAEAAEDLKAVGRITELAFTEAAEVSVTNIEVEEVDA